MTPVNSFIGNGWAWPLAVDATGGVAMVSGETDLEQALYLILSTTPGERPMRPEFGCRLAQFVYAPSNASTAALIAAEVRLSLQQWLPRIAVADVVVSANIDDPCVLWIDISYAVRATNDVRNLVVPFYVIPDHDRTSTGRLEGAA